MRILRDFITTILTLSLFFIGSLLLETYVGTETLIPAMFTLAVFIVSLLTEGYIWGIIASLISVLAINFAFTFPYFEFNFTIPENLLSAIILLVITISSSTLTKKITLQEKMRAESAKEKMRANLLRAVSHDLRTPLTTIYGSSSTIVDQYDDLSKESLVSLASGIKEDAQWLINMVENLLTITRIDNQVVKIKKDLVVLEELIDIVLVKMKKRYPHQKIQTILPDDFMMIPMDVVLIEQVILNLLENAIKHAKGMTELKLMVEIKGNQAIFQVMDNGCGIEKERIKEIFKGYYEKKDAPADYQKSSMGIGLSVCASIIKAHDGQINVENLKDGGCCFSFTLDLEASEDE